MPVLANAPDPNPKKPKLVCPPGAVDTHIHLFGPLAKYPINPGAKYTPREILPEHSIALQNKLGLTHAVVVSGGAYGRDYRFLADSLEKYPNRFRGVALMPDDATPEEFERLTKLGVRGLRFMSRAHGMIVPAINADIAARAKEHGWHVQFYPYATDIIEHADLLLALDNTIVLDHFACVPGEGGIEQEAFQTVLRMLDTGRVWVKLSGPMRCSKQEYPHANMTPLARALVRHAPERMVWATDWPHVNMNDRQMPNDGDLLDLMLDWVPDDATRSRILADNPRVLYGFPRAR